jgi:penicillin-binding protein 1C
MGLIKQLKRQKPSALLVYLLLLVSLLAFAFSLPRPLFSDPTSTVIEDRNGVLLGAKIAGDQQWRFPYNPRVPYKYEKAVLLFEDRNFYYHNGFNPFSFARALVQNIRSGRVVSGGSTISMQLIRLSRKGKKRTIGEKIIEALLSLRMELTYSKREILALYASNAPFGSNVVGLDAASWRYFGKAPDRLSWAEATTLAVLPNSPSLIYPGKNQEKLKIKRDRLLGRLYDAGVINQDELMLAQNEELPGHPHPLPKLAPHLLDRAIKDGYRGQRIQSTLDARLQSLAISITDRYNTKYSSNHIHNAAILVIETETGNAICYVGNSGQSQIADHGNDVDIITSPRSTGSILKPFLYAAMLSEGQILPGTLVPDIPTQIGNFMPENYNYTYDGAVPARRALARSLNIPAVKMLQQLGTEKFNYVLKKAGLTTLNKPASHYGLSIILGGAEATLWDLAGAYAGMARIVNHYSRFDGSYSHDDIRPANYILAHEKNTSNGNEKNSLFSASAIWFTFEAMNEVSRPDEDVEWRIFSSSSRVAWKTGTSYGSRDAWAIGCTPDYIVAAWVGNADGEGRPGLTGLTHAAPLIFEMLRTLRPAGWFSKPFDDMEKIAVCRLSGYRASRICTETDTVWVPGKGVKTQICPYHRLVHLDRSGMWRVNSECEEISGIQTQSWFVLPPVMEHFFKARNPFYKVLPPFREDCGSHEEGLSSMDMIYPRDLSRLYIPYDLNGKKSKVVFKAAHRQAGAKIYWYVDGLYAGFTEEVHHLALSPDAGWHTLTLTDEYGETLIRKFEVLEGKKQTNR